MLHMNSMRILMTVMTMLKAGRKNLKFSYQVAIYFLKSTKSPGPDEVPAQLIKYTLMNQVPQSPIAFVIKSGEQNTWPIE